MEVSQQCNSCKDKTPWWCVRSQSKHFKDGVLGVWTQFKTSSSSKRSISDPVCRQQCLPNRSSSKLPLLKVDDRLSLNISESRTTKINWNMKTIWKLKLLISSFKHLEIIPTPALTIIMILIFADFWYKVNCFKWASKRGRWWVCSSWTSYGLRYQAQMSQSKPCMIQASTSGNRQKMTISAVWFARFQKTCTLV